MRTLEQFRELYQKHTEEILPNLPKIKSYAWGERYIKLAILREAESDFEKYPDITNEEASAVVLSHISECLVDKGYKGLSNSRVIKLSSWHCPNCRSNTTINVFKRVRSGEYGIICYTCGYTEVKNERVPA